MKLYTVRLQNGEQKVCVENRTDPTRLHPVEEIGLKALDMNTLICGMTEEIRQRLQALSENQCSGITKNDVRILAPIPHPLQEIICLGMNYRAHEAEAARYSADAFSGSREKCVYFCKRVNACQGTGAVIPGHFDLTDKLDYENELAVILGKDARDVRREEAFDYVFGYTIINDVSARDLQTGHKQWYFGKSLDGFCPMGPCILTREDVGDPPALAIRTWINGELRQDSCTSDLIFDIPGVLAELTRGMTLRAGTIIATGTPAGVGMGFDPPKFLHHGDVVCCEIEKIGILENTVE